MILGKTRQNDPMTFQTMLLDNPDFPTCLRTMNDPPAQLNWVGQPIAKWLERPRVAIVGSRKVSGYGRQTTLQLASELAQAGVVIISGLALGVDALAHQGALEAGGTTVAVLPCSLDKIYPAHNEQLGKRIAAQGGTLISEYSTDMPYMNKYNFVARNRIISGLADAVLITEAALDSGSLHTADFALQQGREVLVVPGNITSPTSAGTNSLLKIGATPVTNSHDVLQALGLTVTSKAQQRTGGTPAEQIILDLVSDNVHEGDQLLAASQLPTDLFNQSLTMLEITGKITAGGANSWY